MILIMKCNYLEVEILLEKYTLLILLINLIVKVSIQVIKSEKKEVEESHSIFTILMKT